MYATTIKTRMDPIPTSIKEDTKYVVHNNENYKYCIVCYFEECKVSNETVLLLSNNILKKLF